MATLIPLAPLVIIQPADAEGTKTFIFDHGKFAVEHQPNGVIHFSRYTDGEWRACTSSELMPLMLQVIEHQHEQLHRLIG
jgi:hypothetical protein